MSVFEGDAVSRAWGDPIATWDYSSGVAAVDFTNLGDYRDLLIVFEGVTNNSGGTDALALRVSTDNGSTFAATNYVNIGSSSTLLILIGGAVAAATAQGGIAQVFNLNAAALKTRVLSSSGTEGSASSASTRIGTHTAAVNNALRFLWLSGSNFAGGAFRIYARS